MMLVTVVFGILLFGLLVAIAIIDFGELRIPNQLNICLSLLGVGWVLYSNPHGLLFQACFALAITSFFWILRELHRRLRGTVGLGLGDVKMAGAAGFWFSPYSISLFLFSASISALVYTVIIKNLQANRQIPFGPFLAFGLFTCWLWELKVD
ncbi:MAG: prepilin peptidase [Rhodobacteraceae bacterium]|nr:prepilin peptidase [Paracoccaceae bacterium]